MNYTIKIDSNSAKIIELPEVYLHFGHLDFNYVWNPETKHQDRVNEDVYYGGMGEGSKLKTWQDAIHTSLYDAFQVYDELKDGDTFTAEYLGQNASFVCAGVHVMTQDEYNRNKAAGFQI